MKDDGDTMVIKDLVLIGGGHSHVYVLKNFGMKPMPGVRVTVVARDVMTPYSGMLPGNVAGHYTYEQCHVDLRPLVAFSKGRLIHAPAIGLDTENRYVILPVRPPIKYDVLSIDIGITPRTQEMPGVEAFTTPVKPINGFSARWEALVLRVMEGEGATKVVLVGGGAGGTELALSMQFRLRSELAKAGKSSSLVHFTLVTRSRLLPTHNNGVRRRFRKVINESGMELLEGSAVKSVHDNNSKSGHKYSVVLEGGRELPADECIWCTDGGAQSWPAEAGLAADGKGFLKVLPTLESISHTNIFACGDIANV